MTSISLNNIFQKHAASFASDVASQIVKQLSTKHGFDADNELRELGIAEITIRTGPASGKQQHVKKTEKRDTPEIPLPWCGKVTEGWCNGLRLNHGLYSQCTMIPHSNGIYCSTCQKSADTGSTGKPAYGNVTDRLQCDVLEYVDPKGRKCAPYANVVQKLGICHVKAREVAARFGMNIPDEQFQAKVLKRGRPKKDATVSDSSDEETTLKRSRGRPKKEKKQVLNAGGAVLDSIHNDADDASITINVSHTTSHPSSPVDSHAASHATSPATSPAASPTASHAASPTASPTASPAASPAASHAASIAASHPPFQPAPFQPAEHSCMEDAHSNSPKSASSHAEEKKKTKVSKVKVDGKKYLKDADNNLYDRKTKEHLGALVDGNFVPVDDDDDDDDTSCSN